MTARHEGGQAQFPHEIDRLRRLAAEAESTKVYELAADYYRRALDLIDSSGADTNLRPKIEEALDRVRTGSRS